MIFPGFVAIIDQREISPGPGFKAVTYVPTNCDSANVD